MNISQSTKNRIQVKNENALIYLTDDTSDIAEGDILCLAKPTQGYYEGNILYTAGEYDIKNIIIFSYKLEEQIIYHMIVDEINIVYVNKSIDIDKNDIKILENIEKCNILITNISTIDDLSSIVTSLSPNIVCVNEGFVNSESYEKFKSFKVKMNDISQDDENVRYVLLQK